MTCCFPLFCYSIESFVLWLYKVCANFDFVKFLFLVLFILNLIVKVYKWKILLIKKSISTMWSIIVRFECMLIWKVDKHLPTPRKNRCPFTSLNLILTPYTSCTLLTSLLSNKGPNAGVQKMVDRWPRSAQLWPQFLAPILHFYFSLWN